jgi:anti-sigma regulatory factor (Ser/Thr protein kinase)
VSKKSQILVVGLPAVDQSVLEDASEHFELIRLDESEAAVDWLRAHGHTVPLAFLGSKLLVDSLEELVVYLKHSFPEVALVTVGEVSPPDEKRLQLLGVSRFLDSPVDADTLSPILERAASGVKKPEHSDWDVSVSHGDWIEVTAPSNEEYVPRIQELLDLLERTKLPKDTRDELILAIDELVRNAMEWGNRYDLDKRVRVSYYYAEDRVLLKVEDEGEGFTVGNLSDPTKDMAGHIASREEEGKRPGGLGVHLIRNLMDDFKLEFNS